MHNRIYFKFWLIK